MHYVTKAITFQTIFRIPSRLDQIKFEESVDKCVVEAAHEKLVFLMMQVFA